MAAPDEDENIIQKSISPFRKGGEGDLILFLLRHCEERLMRRGNLCYPIYHSNESGVFSQTNRESHLFQYDNSTHNKR